MIALGLWSEKTLKHGVKQKVFTSVYLCYMHSCFVWPSDLQLLSNFMTSAHCLSSMHQLVCIIVIPPLQLFTFLSCYVASSIQF